MKTIPLTQGQVALVDDCDYKRVAAFKWNASLASNGRWYAARADNSKGKQRRLLLSRFILGLDYGDKRQADHRDRTNTLDNRRQNLRVAVGQNSQNIGLPKHNTSGFKGVIVEPKEKGQRKHKGYRARIRVNRSLISLGTFSTSVLAAKAYDTAAIRYHGEFAVTNISLGLLRCNQ